ncbi:hypothetical protein HY086_04510 [Candidatus Gottesmanbacteria bacterium]|nr:hypothetical protein [Candidatus Gottesmanbacteria bacterium]
MFTKISLFVLLVLAIIGFFTVINVFEQSVRPVANENTKPAAAPTTIVARFDPTTVSAPTSVTPTQTPTKTPNPLLNKVEKASNSVRFMDLRVNADKIYGRVEMDDQLKPFVYQVLAKNDQWPVSFIMEMNSNLTFSGFASRGNYKLVVVFRVDDEFVESPDLDDFLWMPLVVRINNAPGYSCTPLHPVEKKITFERGTVVEKLIGRRYQPDEVVYVKVQSGSITAWVKANHLNLYPFDLLDVPDQLDECS